MPVPALLRGRQREIADLCRSYGVTGLRLFGSATRPDFDPSSSDVDLLVDFAPPVGRNRFQQFIRFKLEIESLLGGPVDLVPAASLRDARFRAAAEAGAIELYAA